MTATASQRIAIVEVAAEVARVRVQDTIALSRQLRTNTAMTETTSSMFGQKTVGQDDVVLTLAWLVYQAAMGALTAEDRLAVLEELFELTKAESAIAPRLRRGLPNDGRRAAGLIGQTLAGGKYFWSEYDDAAAELARRVLAGLATHSPTPDEADAIRALVSPSVAVERHQAWTEGNKFVWSKHLIMEGHPGWTTRTGILEQIRSLLEDDQVPLGSRIVLWALLVEAHRLANYAALHGPKEFGLRMRTAFLTELTWALDVLTRRGAPFEEMSAARDLWDWHARYDRDDELKGAALRLETLYIQNELASEFEPLLEFDTTETIERNAAAKAAELAKQDEHGINGFIERGVRFLGPEKKFFALLGVASVLGEYADTANGVRTFVEGVLSGKTKGEQRLEFAVVAAARWFFRQRRSDGASALELLKSLLKICEDDNVRARLLLECYGVVAPRWSSDQISDEEHAFLRSQEATFRSIDKLPWFVSLIGSSPRHRWGEFKAQIERILGGLAEPRRTEAIASLIHGVFWAVHKRGASEFPADLNKWLLDQVLRVSDFDELSNMLEWRLDETIKVLGRLPITWLPAALKQRAAREKEEGASVARALSFDMGLSEYVTCIQRGQAEDPTVIGAVQELIDLVDDRGMVGFRLPELLQEIDPDGFVLPRLLAERMAVGGEAVEKFARLAKAYVVGTPAWRTIATPVLAHARTLDSHEERVGLYHAIYEPGVRSWSGTPGQVPPVFVSEVERSKKRREEETDPIFIPLWDWGVAIVEADLRYQQGRAKEEREENDEES